MTKDNWIKAFDDLRGMGLCCNCGEDHQIYKEFVEKVEKDAIEKTNKRWEKREKLKEESFKYRITPVVDLDNPENNCEVCGYSHKEETDFNERAYSFEHLMRDIRKVWKIVKINEPVATHIDDEPLHKQSPIVVWGKARNSLREEIREVLSDLLEGKK